MKDRINTILSNFFPTKSFLVEKHSILLVPFGLGVGIWVYFSFLTNTISLYTLVAIFLGLLTVQILYRIWDRGTMFFVPFVVRGLTLLLLGCIVSAIRVDSFQMQPVKYWGICTVSGVVTHVNYSVKKTQVVLDTVRIDFKPVKGKVQLYVSKAVAKGSRIRVRAILYSPSKPVVPGAFDFRFYAYFKGMQAYGKAITDPIVLKEGKDSLRYRITKGMYTALPAPLAGLGTALVTGNRLGIFPQDVEALRGSGLAHLLAISGLHISLTMVSVYVFIRFLSVYLFKEYSTQYPIKKIASGVSVLFGGVYVMLAGFSIPTLRAFFMAILVVFGVLLNRKVLTFRSVALSASVILLIMPESLFTPSFQLSFAAVSMLIFVHERGYIAGKGVWSYVRNLCLSSTAVMFATIPFTVYYFGSISVYGVIANIIAIPLMGVIVIPCLLIGVVIFLLFHLTFFLHVSGFAMDILLKWAHFMYALPGSVLVVPRLSLLTLVCLVLGCYAFVVFNGIGKYMAMGFFAVGIVWVLTPKIPADAYISNKGVLAVKYGATYIFSGRYNRYFARSIQLQTGFRVKKGEICSGQICYVKSIAYVYGKVFPPSLCRKKGETKIKLIVAPRAFIKNCAVASVDKMDISLNGGYVIRNAIPSFTKDAHYPWQSIY